MHSKQNGLSAAGTQGTRELTQEEIRQVSGGFQGILVGYAPMEIRLEQTYEAAWGYAGSLDLRVRH